MAKLRGLDPQVKRKEKFTEQIFYAHEIATLSIFLCHLIFNSIWDKRFIQRQVTSQGELVQRIKT